MDLKVVFFWFILRVVTAQDLLQPKPLNGIRDQNLTVTCTFPPGTITSELRLNGNNIMSATKFIDLVAVSSTVVRYRYGPLEDSDSGSTFVCDGFGGSPDSATLNVLYGPVIGGLQSSLSTNLRSRIVLNFSIDANPPTSRPLLTRLGSTTRIEDSSITISDTSITFSSVLCNHNGTYSILSSNDVGNVSATFSIIVKRSVPMLTPATLSATREKAPSGIASQVVACPDDRIVITCSVPGRSPIDREIVAGQDFLWQRLDFVDNSLTSGTVEISCRGTNFNTGPPIPFIVSYGPLGCGDVVYCYVTIIVVIIGVVLILGIVVVLIVSCYFICKKKDPGSGSEELKEKELDEKL